jgi:hypothetical protein
LVGIVLDLGGQEKGARGDQQFDRPASYLGGSAGG